MRRMVLWRIIVLLFFAVTIRVHSQLDSNGFLSLDCGLPADTSYFQSDTNLLYISDAKFIETGNSSQTSTDTVGREYLTRRYFPVGTRNCYTIRYLTVGFQYLVRAVFRYGNYDDKNKPPTFDIYLGINFWQEINGSIFYYTEIIFNATANDLQVCLVDKGMGIPFISTLDLRQLKAGTEYPFVNSTRLLVSIWRADIGSNNTLKYPDDESDRWWTNYTQSDWNQISNSTPIDPDTEFDTPSLALQTAATTSSTKIPLTLSWSSLTNQMKFYGILHFAEIQLSTGLREFNILVNGDHIFDNTYIPGLPGCRKYFIPEALNHHNVSLVATLDSTLPPLLNAMELYQVLPVGVPTQSEDVVAINGIKESYKIKNGWSGDPCLPTQFSWTGINCTTDSSNTTRITVLNLSSSSLTGLMIDFFGNLTALEYLDLSNNNLIGPLPTSLDSLTALKVLNITGNPYILTTLPPELLKKQTNGSLEFRYGSPPPSPPPPPPPPPIIIIVIAVVVPLLVIAVVVALVLVLKRAKDHTQSTVPNQNEGHQPYPQQNYHENVYANTPQVENRVGKPKKETEQIFPKFENQKFSYGDLKNITNYFKTIIGTGGYGKVYLGQLENRIEVAVKMLSESSHQGVKEFLAEAENLSRVHHKNLIALMGYCTDQNCMALVYEYMQEGNLCDKLKDKASPLSWKQRLQIAYESAQGLEYLHKSCNPPLIHRDVKTSNILLNGNLEAKIADFGLSRAFDNYLSSHVSTRIVGTVGYLDPEYYLSNQLSAKSDVFSFGVVLLEIITGRAPIGAGVEGGNLVQWVRRQLSGGNIEAIVDPKLQEKYDINSIWNVADLACNCTEPTSSKRPTMSAVVINLKESLDLEISMEQMHTERTDNLPTYVSQTSNFEMAYMGGNGMPLIGPNVR